MFCTKLCCAILFGVCIKIQGSLYGYGKCKSFPLKVCCVVKVRKFISPLKKRESSLLPTWIKQDRNHMPLSSASFHLAGHAAAC